MEMQKRLMGVDLGTKRIGVALTDPLNIITQRYKTVPFKDNDNLAEELNIIIKEKDVGLIIFGLPLTLSGKDSEKTTETRALIDFLKTKFPTDVEVDLEDEALTTTEAHEIMRAMGKKPSKNRDIVDQVAAQCILNSYKRRTGR